jgi:hypothetical protein
MKILQRRKDKQATVPKAEVEKVNIQPTTKANKNDNRSVRSKLGRSKKKGEKVVEDDDATWWPKATDEDDAATQCSSSTAATKDRKGQKQVLYTHFGDFPKDVLEVTMDPKPKVEHPTDVVVKVEVRSFIQTVRIPPNQRDTHTHTTIQSSTLLLGIFGDTQ